MQCVHHLRNRTCVASCSSLSLAVSSLCLACSHSPVCCCCFSFSNFFSFFVCHRILTFFQTVRVLLCTTFFTLTVALRPWSHSFVCDTRTTLFREGKDPSNSGISFLGTPTLSKQLSHVRTDQCGEDAKFEANIGAKILNSTAPSSSRCSEGSCRSNLIIFVRNFTRALVVFSGATSTHFRL